MAETLRVNPIQCSGHGVCAELLPELVTLDEWGYPVIDPGPVPPVLDRDARRAVSACPALALRLVSRDRGLTVDACCWSGLTSCGLSTPCWTLAVSW